VAAASGLLGLGMLARFFSYQGAGPQKTEFGLGLVEDFPVGSRTLQTQVPALLVRSAGGFAAFSLTCTHLGCSLQQEAEGFTCPCHGSQFDEEGRVLRGPAVQDLERLQVIVDESDHVIIHID
jgi:cytochrome b6-f complex iron-sulfur subunit